MPRTLKICLVCVAWAAIGTKIALSFSPLWLALPIGIISGCLGGYLTCDWRTVAWAIPHAWRRATSWRPYKEYWIAVWCNILILSVFFCSAWLLFSIIIACVAGVEVTGKYIINLIILFFASWLLSIFGAFVVSFDFRRNSTPLYKLDDLRKLAKYFNFFSFWFWLVPKIFFKAATYLLKNIHLVPGFTQRTIIRVGRGFACASITITCFLWHLYRLIHTEERWLCSIDIACGIILGSYLASPIIGGLSGGAFWLMNRVLIAGYLLRTLPVCIKRSL